mmetsp:Transcript_10352/g.22800  ORF Transcript_10352/g.22800 Transcript_10352/m.22800 type:complete len:215 (-) Transcript_10352:3047-3691(-)
MLHCVSHVRGLDQVLNHNGSLSVGVDLGGFTQSTLLGKGFLPTLIAKILQILVHNVCGKHTIDHQMSKVNLVIRCGTDNVAECFKLVFHQELPGEVHTVLFCDTFAAIDGIQRGVFHNQLGIWDTLVVNIMDQSREYASKLSERITSDSIRVIVKRHRHSNISLLCHLDGVIGRSHNTAQKLDNRHCHMGCMLKAMKWVVAIHDCNNADKFLQL